MVREEEGVLVDQYTRDGWECERERTVILSEGRTAGAAAAAALMTMLCLHYTLSGGWIGIMKGVRCA
jgi:hypothetical protein